MTDLVEAFTKNSKDLVSLYKSIDTEGRIHVRYVRRNSLDIIKILSYYFDYSASRSTVRKDVFTCGITTRRQSNKTEALNEILKHAKDSNYFVQRFSSYRDESLRGTRFLSGAFSRAPTSYIIRKVRDRLMGCRVDGGIILLDELSPDEPRVAELLDEIDDLIAQAGGKPILVIYAKS